MTIGPRTVVHPKARIIAEAGPIFIGEGNLIGWLFVCSVTCVLLEEQSEIINRIDDGAEPGTTVPVMIIGNNNVFEVAKSRYSPNLPHKVGSVSESLKIGDSNILEAKCFVGRQANLSNGCIVGAGCRWGAMVVSWTWSVTFIVHCLFHCLFSFHYPLSIHFTLSFHCPSSFHCQLSIECNLS